MVSHSNENRILLAIAALERDPKLTVRAAAKIYGVPQLEEQAVVQYVLELATRSFPPRLRGVEEMANELLRVRDAPPVGKLWAHRFVKRRPELQTRFSRRYDYQRAKCEDPNIIGPWFDLIRNTKAKYGILNDDTYNFDETGFLMGMIFTGMVVTTSDGRRQRTRAIPPFIILAGQHHLANWYQECDLPADWRIATTDNGWTTNEVGLDWIKHFDCHTASRTKGSYRLLILDGHESHHSTEFELYCKEHNIITLCMPSHSSHILQPLDVGCFGPLKQAYGRQVEELMRTHVTHISKLEFLCAFRQAFFSSMTEKNIQGGFSGAGLVPYDPQRVLAKLDVRIRTPTPPVIPVEIQLPWVSKTPRNAYEASSQSKHIKTRISTHQNSSPTSVLAAMDKFERGATAMMHEVALLRVEVSSLRKANEGLSKRRRAKKTRVQLGGSLTVQDAQDLLDQKDLDEQIKKEERQGRGRGGAARTKVPRCSNCGGIGHNQYGTPSCVVRAQESAFRGENQLIEVIGWVPARLDTRPNRKSIKEEYKPTTDMIADGLTKPMSGTAFQQFVKNIGLTDISHHLERRRLNDMTEEDLFQGMSKLNLGEDMAVSACAASTGGV
ncbi:hypothetical protein PCL_12105 [Purpureocillium lilacinum]|uniref:HTH CENPB-type domain-containing protein n=1 Tax=Purpureocillium lilacinum TaxID=33203 RepID=A0A2U3DPH0_PURLI|nr:hypothetical protein PCL_12105 [Purpureocillium lilacinum]